MNTPHQKVITEMPVLNRLQRFAVLELKKLQPGHFVEQAEKFHLREKVTTKCSTFCVCVYVCVYIYTDTYYKFVYIYVYMCIYIYRERERNKGTSFSC